MVSLAVHQWNSQLLEVHHLTSLLTPKTQTKRSWQLGENWGAGEEHFNCPRLPHSVTVHQTTWKL